MGGGAPLLLHGLQRYARPQRVWFFGCFVRNSVSIFAILVSYRVWFLHSSLELGMFFLIGRYMYVSSLAIRPSTKALHKCLNNGLNYRTNYLAGLKQGIELNRVSNFWSGHKQGEENHRFWS